MNRIRLFHRTSVESARMIMSEGFRDSKNLYFPEGVFLSNYPLDCNAGAKGPVLIGVLLEESLHNMFYEYEIVEAGKLYREFIMPASILNDSIRCSYRLLDDDDDAVAESNSDYWNEYPPGEPHATFVELEAEDADLL